MKAKEIVKRFVKDERGLETVEYAVILGLIVVATIVLVIQLGGWVAQQFRDVLTNVGETPAG
jgi:Flp pilus assembly pilin Flp